MTITEKDIKLNKQSLERFIKTNRNEYCVYRTSSSDSPILVEIEPYVPYLEKEVEEIVSTIDDVNVTLDRAVRKVVCKLRGVIEENGEFIVYDMIPEH